MTVRQYTLCLITGFLVLNSSDLVSSEFWRGLVIILGATAGLYGIVGLMGQRWQEVE